MSTGSMPGAPNGAGILTDTTPAGAPPVPNVAGNPIGFGVAPLTGPVAPPQEGLPTRTIPVKLIFKSIFTQMQGAGAKGVFTQAELHELILSILSGSGEI